MVSVAIKALSGQEEGKLELSDAVFAIEPNVHCVRQAVNAMNANGRAGTHSTKMRGQVRGGGRKPWRQKGTGRARAGSSRSPIWRGGAIIFGPQPRSYAVKVNRKVRAKAYCSIWSELLSEGNLIVVKEFAMSKPSTKDLSAMLDGLGVEGSALVITAETDLSVALAGRNIDGVSVVNADNINVIDMLTHDCVVTTPEVLKRVEATYVK